MSDVLSEVKEVIGDVMKSNEAELAKITLETDFIDDLKADSMDVFFLMDGFCEKFNLTISDGDAQKIRKVGDVVQYVETHR